MMADDEWQEILAREQAQEAQARQLAEIGRPRRFVSWRNPTHFFVVTPEIYEGAEPGTWRLTTLVGREPWGHEGYFTAREAFLDAIRRGDLIEEPPGLGR